MLSYGILNYIYMMCNQMIPLINADAFLSREDQWALSGIISFDSYLLFY